MPVVVRGNASKIAVNIPTSFKASGGTGPYTYSVLAGGSGGSISSSTGLYTAPSTINDQDPSKNTDTIVATDFLTIKGRTSITVMSPLDLFCDIIQTEMSLANGRVYLWDQKIKEPTDFDPYIIVSVLNAKPFGTSNKMDSSGNSVQSVNMQATLSVDIKSRGIGALTRKEEIIMALDSNYSRQQQDANAFSLAKLSSSFTNLSNEDGAAIPYRFNITVNMIYTVKKTKAVAYYDTLSDVTVTVEP